VFIYGLQSQTNINVDYAGNKYSKQHFWEKSPWGVDHHLEHKSEKKRKYALIARYR